MVDDDATPVAALRGERRPALLLLESWVAASETVVGDLPAPSAMDDEEDGKRLWRLMLLPLEACVRPVVRDSDGEEGASKSTSKLRL